MTLTRPHRTVLNWLWQGVVLIRQVYRWNAHRIQTRRQTRLMMHSAITVPATPTAPQPVELPTLTSTEQETLQVSEAVSQQMVEPVHRFTEPVPIPDRPAVSHQPIEPVHQPIEPVSTPDRPPADSSPTEHPPQSRSQLVMSLLDEAWGQGMTTYPQLIAYVAAQTGTGCSKRVVAQWKRERKLLDEGV
jgi:hypothetical protein